MADVSARTWATTAIETREPRIGAATTPAAPEARRRHEFAVLRFLLAITGIILALALTLGRQSVV